MKIESIIDYIKWRYENIEIGVMFRGQLDSNWELLPSIVRYAKNKEVSDGYDSISEIENHLIEWLEKFAMPYKDYRSFSQAEKLVHGQHFGLPTRLLDWTTNPLKALYFAVENPEYDSVDGIVYSFAPFDWDEKVGHATEHTSGLVSFFPELLNERLSAQEGCFIAFPLPKNGFSVLPLNIANYPKDTESFFSVQISAKHKRNIRQELNGLGINHRTIYPGLEGVAKWIKSDLSHFSA